MSNNPFSRIEKRIIESNRLLERIAIALEGKKPLPRSLERYRMPGESTEHQQTRAEFLRLFSVRVAKALCRLNVNSIVELAEKTSEDLLEAKNFGRMSLGEVVHVLSKHGMRLKIK